MSDGQRAVIRLDVRWSKVRVQRGVAIRVQRADSQRPGVTHTAWLSDLWPSDCRSWDSLRSNSHRSCGLVSEGKRQLRRIRKLMRRAQRRIRAVVDEEPGAVLCKVPLTRLATDRLPVLDGPLVMASLTATRILGGMSFASSAAIVPTVETARKRSHWTIIIWTRMCSYKYYSLREGMYECMHVSVCVYTCILICIY